jgi:DNA-binding beta-propeller fold protein YncE
VGSPALAKVKAQQGDPPGSGVIRTVAGSNVRGFGGDGGSATSAAFDQPRAAAVGPDGRVYVADTFNHRVRRVEPGGAVTTLVGTGEPDFSGDGGPASAATLQLPQALAVDPAGAALFIADSGNHRVRRVDLATGVITTFAGGPAPGFTGDGGPATAALLQDPKGVAAAPSGDVYIADAGNERVRRVDRNGTITTVAGTGTEGFAGDGGPAPAAQLNHPRGVAVDGHGLLFVVDSMNHRVRIVDPSGIIATVAGCGRQGFSGDGGSATGARLFEPRGLAVDLAGHLFVADSYNDRIRRVDDPRPGPSTARCATK